MPQFMFFQSVPKDFPGAIREASDDAQYILLICGMFVNMFIVFSSFLHLFFSGGFSEHVIL